MLPNCDKPRRLGTLLLALTLAACSSAPKTPVSDTTASTVQAPSELPREYREALQLMENGRYAEAVAPLQKLTQKRQEWSGPYTNLGIAYAHLGQNEAALQALEQAVRANPSNAAAHNQLGMLYREAGRFDAARAAYQAALKANPNYGLAHRNLGILFDLYLQQPAQALQHYRAYAAQQAGKDEEIAMWIAELEQRMGNRGQ